MSQSEKQLEQELIDAGPNREAVVKKYLLAGGDKAEIVKRLQSKRKPGRLESPNDKKVNPIQTK